MVNRCVVPYLFEWAVGARAVPHIPAVFLLEVLQDWRGILLNLSLR